MRRTLAATSLALALSASLAPAPVGAEPAGGSASGSSASPGTRVLESRVIGRSVEGRAIRAWRLGERRTASTGRIPRVVLISTMHGNEPATRHILTSLRDGHPIVGIDVWVVPVYNPDGLRAGSRRNARGVDLNRNYPNNWAPLSGNYYSGPKPASEPETRAMMRFLREVDPDFVLSFHQPLNGVDVNVERPRFARKVARHLRLPTTNLDCGGTCHGTMTGWFNNNFDGFALTIEYGARPGLRRMRQVAPAQVLDVFDAFAARPAR
jgi:murein peptide amidase A